MTYYRQGWLSKSIDDWLLSVKGPKQRQPTSWMKTAVRRPLMMIEANVAVRVKR